ncbi:mechanosensitive ion channel family protein [Streptomyces sp. NPDC002644]
MTGSAVDLGRGLEEAWSRVAVFVPRLAGFLVVLGVGWVVARTAAGVLERVLRRLGSERLAERAGVRRLLRESAYDMTGIVCRVVRYALLLVVLRLALGVFGANPVSAVIDGVVAWVPRGVVAVVLVVVALAVADGARHVVRAVLATVPYGKGVAGGVWAAIVVLGVIAALEQAGIATGVVLPVLYAGLGTVAGVVVVGVGGGLIVPMRARWERWLTRAEQEVSAARVSLSTYRATQAAAPGPAAPGSAPSGPAPSASSAPGGSAPGSAPGGSAPGGSALGGSAPGSAGPGSAGPGSARPGSASPGPAAPGTPPPGPSRPGPGRD